MSYELEFDPRAWKEWKKLDRTVQEQFKKRLAEVVNKPRIESNKLREFPDCYRIKLRRSGYRLVYQVREQAIVIFVIAIGKRDRKRVYKSARKRL